jgi:4-amino-4-deoxy-L-arabinose transferase-like glycosyltransferase
MMLNSCPTVRKSSLRRIYADLTELKEKRIVESPSAPPEADRQSEAKGGLRLIGLLALLCYLPGLATYKMLDPTDSFFVETGREMLLAHHYITPLFNYAPWLDKPAFPFLLIVAFYKIFGVHAWAARLPSALSAVALTMCTYSSAARMLTRRAGFFAGIILAASPLFCAVGHLALSDEPLALFIGVALLGFARALVSDKSEPLFLPYLSLALAILCKGPIGLVLSAGILIAYLLISSQTTSDALARLKQLRVFTGAGILLVVCLPYYLAAHAATDGAFSQEFFFHQNLGRAEGTVNHQQPLWWYVPVAFFGFFPWTVFLSTAGQWFRTLWFARKERDARQSYLLFCFVWAIFVLLFFSAIPTKLPTYIVPMSPALAIVVGAYLDYLMVRRDRRRLMISSTTVLIIALAGLVACVIFRSDFGFLNTPILSSISLVMIMLMLSWILLARWRLQAAVLTLTLAGYLGCALLVPLSFCQFYKSHQVGIERLIILSKERGATLGILFNTVPSAIFLYEKRIETLNSLDEVAAFSRKGAAPHYLLATGNCLKIPELKATEHTIGQAGKWYLLAIDGYLKENTDSRR